MLSVDGGALAALRGHQNASENTRTEYACIYNRERRKVRRERKERRERREYEMAESTIHDAKIK